MNFMKRLLIVVVLLSCAGAVRADPVKIKLGTLAPKGSLYYRTLQEMGEAFRAAEGAGSSFTIYGDGSQGSEADVVRRMRIGQLNAAMMTGTVASPSSPSVRFTALPAPTMMKAPNTTKNQPSGSTSSLKNGKVSEVANAPRPRLAMA